MFDVREMATPKPRKKGIRKIEVESEDEEPTPVTVASPAPALAPAPIVEVPSATPEPFHAATKRTTPLEDDVTDDREPKRPRIADDDEGESEIERDEPVTLPSALTLTAKKGKDKKKDDSGLKKRASSSSIKSNASSTSAAAAAAAAMLQKNCNLVQHVALPTVLSLECSRDPILCSSILPPPSSVPCN